MTWRRALELVALVFILPFVFIWSLFAQTRDAVNRWIEQLWD